MVGKQAQCGKCGTWFTVMPPDAVATGGGGAPGAFPEAPPAPKSPFQGPPVQKPPEERPAESAPPPPPKSPRAVRKAGPASGEKCPKCNAALPKGAVLCVQCGTFLKEPEKKGARKKSSSTSLLAGVAVLCVVGAAGWYGWQWYSSREEAGQPSQPSGAPAGPPAASPAPGTPPAPPAAMPQPPGPGVPPPMPSVPKPSATIPRVNIAPLSRQEIEPYSKLPAEDSAGLDREIPPKPPLSVTQILSQAVDLKGPLMDRFEPEKSPRLGAGTRLITVRFLWRQTELDKAAPLNAQTVRVTTDLVPGALYGVHFTSLLSYGGWMPRGANEDNSTILESVQLVTRRIGDYTAEMLASGGLLARSAYTNWFGNVVGRINRQELRAAAALNQFYNTANSRLEIESGSFFCPDDSLKLHLLVPSSARLVRVQYGEHTLLVIPVDGLAGIPSASQPNPKPFINSAIEKARQLLASSKTDEIVAGARMLTEAGNLDKDDKLKPEAFSLWTGSVTQLLAHAESDCRVAAMETLLQSRHVEPRFRLQLIRSAIATADLPVRRRAAELVGESPMLIDQAFTETMKVLQTLLADTNAAVRAAANVSACRLAVLGDDSAFEFLADAIRGGLTDPSPHVRAAVLEVLPQLQGEDEQQAAPRLEKILLYARLNLFDSNEAVRRQAARTILAIRSPFSAAIIDDVLKRFPEQTLELIADASLETSTGSVDQLPLRAPALALPEVQTALLPALTRFLEEADVKKRQKAARVLGAFYAEVANDAIAEAFQKNETSVRLSLLSSLNSGARALPPPVAIFAAGLNDSDAKVRGATFGLLDDVLADTAATVAMASNVAAQVESPTLRQQVVERILAPVAVSNAPILFAMGPFLEDKNDGVARAALAPFARTPLRFGWKEVEPLWTPLINQESTARRLGAFWILRLAVAEGSQAKEGEEPLAPEQAIAEAAKLLSDDDPQVREAALVFVVPHRTHEHVPAIEKILTDPQRDLTPAVRNQVLVSLAKPSTKEDVQIVDRVRPATEDDKERDLATLNALIQAHPPAPGAPEKPAGKRTYAPTDYRVMVQPISRTGIYLLTRWAMSSNRSANAPANYLLQIVQHALRRSWLLPSERVALAQSLQALSEAPTAATGAKLALSQLDQRFPRGQAAASLAPEQTQGAAESVESIVAFLAPKKRPMIVGEYKSPSGTMIDIWFQTDETVPEAYPPGSGGAEGGPRLSLVSKMEAWRIEPIDRETLARLQWIVANAPKEKVREALLQIAKTEGDLANLSQQVVLEGLVLLAEQGDAQAEAEAERLGWLRIKKT